MKPINRKGRKEENTQSSQRGKTQRAHVETQLIASLPKLIASLPT